MAILAEIKTAGLGVAAFIALLGALLLFGSGWLTGLSGWMEIVLFIAGAVLIILELHAPGISIFGIGGVTCILASFFLTLGGDMKALNILAFSLVAAVVAFMLIVRRLPSSKLWGAVRVKGRPKQRRPVM